MIPKNFFYLDGFVVLVSLDLLSELLDDNVVGVDFQVLLGSHVTRRESKLRKR